MCAAQVIALARCAFAQRLRQLVEDAAMGGGTRLVAAFTQALELLFQLAELLDARGDMANVRVQQGVHIATVFAGGILEMEQSSNLGVRHIQHAATADE
ncbi:hypothetical protein D3C84_1087090 [compost metagenome]